MKLIDVHRICAKLSRAGLSMDKSFHTSIDGLDYSAHVLHEHELDLRPGHDIFGGWYSKLCQGDDCLYIYTGWSRKRRGCMVIVRGDYGLVEDLEPPSAMDFDDDIPW